MWVPSICFSHYLMVLFPLFLWWCELIHAMVDCRQLKSQKVKPWTRGTVLHFFCSEIVSKTNVKQSCKRVGKWMTWKKCGCSTHTLEWRVCVLIDNSELQSSGHLWFSRDWLKLMYLTTYNWVYSRVVKMSKMPVWEYPQKYSDTI